MQLKRVVVTGIGALTPLGNTADEYWQGLSNGVSGAAPITRFDAEKFKTRFACEIKDFDPTQTLDRKEVRRLDLFAQYALCSTQEAVDDSGLEASELATTRTGVIWGSGIGGLKSLEKNIEEYATSGFIPRYSPFMIPQMISDIAAGHISLSLIHI